MDLIIRLLADGALIVILLAAATVLLPRLYARPITIPILVMAGLTSLLIGKIASLLYQPSVARPFLEQGAVAGAAYIDNPGFPSDHALLATAAVLAVSMIVRSSKLVVVLSLLTVCMCVARVLALVHTPLDIVGGVLAGLTGWYWYRKLTN